MEKFKVGDHVRRTRGWNAGMNVGDVGIVVESGDGKLRYQAGHIRVTGYAGWHDEDNFELYTAAAMSPFITAGFPSLRVKAPNHGEADPNGVDAHTPGAKLDAGKLRPTLVLRDMARALKAVIKIATDGAAKYTPGGWLVVPNGRDRYEDADLRHMLERFSGQPVDKDSKSLHLAHEAWNALAKLELALREEDHGTAQA